jgi:hypothetical protein
VATSSDSWPIPAEASLDAISQLLALGQQGFPLVAEPFTPRYQVAASGLLARSLTIAEAAVHLSALSRISELSTLVRSLYEHVVMLAWVAAPQDDSRLDIWQRYDDQQRLRLDADVSSIRGTGAMSDADREWLEEGVRLNAAAGMPPLHVRAEQADEAWSSRLGFDGWASLRGGYASVYRTASTAAHPSLLGLNAVHEEANGHDVFMIEPATDIGPVIGLVTPYVATALFVSSYVLGGPPLDEITTILVELKQRVVEGQAER